MREGRFNERRDNMLTIYDINLYYLRNIDYNKIKKGTIYNLEKIIYIFVCDNKNLLDDIYKGDRIMNKVRDDFDVITYENDSKKEEGYRKGLEEGKKKIQ